MIFRGALIRVEESVAKHPKRLASLLDGIENLCRHPHIGMIGIGNAGIIPDFDEFLTERICTASKQDFFSAGRLDVDSLQDAIEVISGKQAASDFGMYPCGIDLVIARRKLYLEAMRYISPHLTFGLSWWHLILPTALILAGGKLSFIQPEHVIHIKHEERWSPDWYNKTGAPETRQLMSVLQKHVNAPSVDVLLEIRKEAMRDFRKSLPVFILKYSRFRLVCLVKGKRYQLPSQILNAVCRALGRFIQVNTPSGQYA